MVTIETNWRCLIWGHEEDPWAAYYGDYSCVRCGREDTWPVLVWSVADGLVPWARHALYDVRRWFRRVWDSTAKCPGCGQREGWGHTPGCYWDIPF